ncbi:MAG: hypothetical protein K2K32_05275 [Muribaculaceae bacterium]|nr:hypothetical protein [Muribaculaceae bacterium]
MKIANKIKARLNQFAPGEVFTIQDFEVESQNQPSLVRYLNRRVSQKELSRLSKGRYFKPRNTRFGQLLPGPEEVVKDFLIRNDKLIGYISGVPAFARLGLTTQISSQILIGSSVYRRPIERGNFKINFFLQRNEITESNIPLLQLLDAVKYFRKIPASTPNDVILHVSDILREQTVEDRKIMLEAALLYPNYVRAVLGAMLENIGQPFAGLRLSLNGVTSYKLNISKTVLPTITNWNII